MATPETVLNGVILEESYKYARGEVTLPAELGFLVLNKCEIDLHTDLFESIIGFGVSGWQKGTDEVADHIVPITELADLDKEMRDINRVGKGVGPRLYNTPQALSGTAENPHTIGAYLLRAEAGAIKNTRYFATPENPLGQATRAIQHVGLKQRARLRGLESTVEAVHASQYGAEAVIYHQTPDAIRKRRQRQQPPSVLPEAFMVVRNKDLPIVKIGEYHR